MSGYEVVWKRLVKTFSVHKCVFTNLSSLTSKQLFQEKTYVPVKLKLQHAPRALASSNSLPSGKKAVQMPHQLVLKYLSSKTNIVFNQTLFTLFKREICCNDTLKLLYRLFWKGYSRTKAKCYLGNPSNPAKTDKTHGRITLKQKINLVQIIWYIGMPGGCWSFNLTRYISFGQRFYKYRFSVCFGSLTHGQ